MGSLLHTIRAKLIASIVLLSVTAVIIGGVGIYNLSQTNERMSFVVQYGSARIESTDGALQEALKIYRFQKNHILETSLDQKVLWENAISKSDADLATHFNEWEKVASEEGKKELAASRTYYADFMRANVRILQLSREHKNAEAQLLSNTEAHDSFGKLEDHLQMGSPWPANISSSSRKRAQLSTAARNG